MLLLIYDDKWLIIDFPLKLIKSVSLVLNIVFPHIIELARLYLLEFLYDRNFSS